jgi:hypothetical protein
MSLEALTKQIREKGKASDAAFIERQFKEVEVLLREGKKDYGNVTSLLQIVQTNTTLSIRDALVHLAKQLVMARRADAETRAEDAAVALLQGQLEAALKQAQREAVK